jgi:hypothetical protein
MAKFPFFDVNPKINAEQFADARKRSKDLILGASDETLQEGLLWYPGVQEATRKGSLDIGISPTHGSGIVAAVSPNMDFDSNNINAFAEIASMTPAERAMVRESHRQSESNRVINRALSTDFRTRGEEVPENLLKPTGRIPEVQAMMKERAPSISVSSDTNVVKALNILEGADPEEILPRSSSPKVNSFYRNIAGDTSVMTVDGRESDMTANMMRPWQDPRGIGTASLKRGGTTRYEDHEEVMRSILPDLNKSSRIRSFTEGHGITLPGAQAVKWLVGKQIERTRPDGRVMKQGPPRRGQPYI